MENLKKKNTEYRIVQDREHVAFGMPDWEYRYQGQKFAMVQEDYDSHVTERDYVFWSASHPHKDVVDRNKYPLLFAEWTNPETKRQLLRAIEREFQLKDEIYNTMMLDDRIGHNCFDTNSELGNEIKELMTNLDLYFYVESRVLFSPTHKLFNLSIIDNWYMKFKV